MLDLAFVGHFTKDTIVNSQGASTQLGGAYYFGCNVAARMGLRVAVCTRLAREDVESVHNLEALGVSVFPIFTLESTNLRIEYPTDDPDRRIITATGSAGPFTEDDVASLRARTIHVGASIRGEVPIDVIRRLRRQADTISLDVQGFTRVDRDGRLVSETWPDMAKILPLVDVLKTDIAEVTFLTRRNSMREAAAVLGALGPREVLVTHADGLLVLADGTFHEAPWTARQIAGRTGRGDTCTGAYIGKRLSSDAGTATCFAAAVTSRKLEAPGPFVGDIAEVEREIAAVGGRTLAS